MEKVKRKSGVKYREKIYIDGKAIKSPYFTKKSDAKNWKRNKENEREKSIVLGIPIIPKVKLKDYYDSFIERKSLSCEKRTIEHYNGVFKNHILPDFGDLYLSMINASHGEELKTKMKKKMLSNRRINNILISFKAILNDAVNLDHLVKNPLRSTKAFPVPDEPINFWTNEEIKSFLSHNKNNFYYPLFLVALNLGLRKGEVLGLQVSQLDFDSRKITVSHNLSRHGLKSYTKNKKIRTIGMNEVVFQALKKQLRSRNVISNYVFTKPDGGPIDYAHFTERIFYKAVEKAGVKKIKFHECRKSFASNFIMSNGDIMVLKSLLGHQSVEVTQKTYAHLSSEYLQKHATVVSFSG